MMADRFTTITREDFIWRFGKKNPVVRFDLGGGAPRRKMRVEPHPVHLHDADLVAKQLCAVRAAFPMPYDLSVFVVEAVPCIRNQAHTIVFVRTNGPRSQVVESHWEAVEDGLDIDTTAQIAAEENVTLFKTSGHRATDVASWGVTDVRVGDEDDADLPAEGSAETLARLALLDSAVQQVCQMTALQRRREYRIGLIFWGSIAPPHPGVTRMLVAHEYGHVVQIYSENEVGAEHDEYLVEYAQRRGIEHRTETGHGTWHLATQEIFADDFRVLVAGVEIEYWNHPGIPRPETSSDTIRWWQEQVRRRQQLTAVEDEEEGAGDGEGDAQGRGEDDLAGGPVPAVP